mmetsp:Transcript_27968/g.96227  ORF Transcript_27968/g.96227 Transcript_27968/m.96227 type:complete len:265 (+) Transcript_27968:30-824(+)
MLHHVARCSGVAALAAAEAYRRRPARADAEPETPLAGVVPFVGLFLDDASLQRLQARYPSSVKKPSAAYVLLQPTVQLEDANKPAIFAPLMGESGAAALTGRLHVDADTVVLRAAVTAGGNIRGLDGHVPSISWRADGADAEAAAALLSEASEVAEVEELQLTGTICRSEYWAEGKCHLPPMLECPLCAYMKQSPCRDVFILWEDCLNDCDAQGGDDGVRQERFMSTCSAPTLALKDCVEKYPDVFGEMFGGGPPAAGDDEEEE